MYKHAAAVFCRVARYSAVSHCKCGVFINKYTAAVDRRRVARYSAAIHCERAAICIHAAVQAVSARYDSARDNARFRAVGSGFGKIAVVERPQPAFSNVVAMLIFGFFACRPAVRERKRRVITDGYHAIRARAGELVAVKTQHYGRVVRNRDIGSQLNVARKIIIAALKRAAVRRQFRPRSVGVVVNGRFALGVRRGFRLRRKSGGNGQTYRKHNRNA